jgi:hypothetical protein
MAKAQKKAPVKKAPAPAATKHARIELSAGDYDRLRGVAKGQGLPIAAYIRQAVLQKVRRDENGEVSGV